MVVRFILEAYHVENELQRSTKILEQENISVS